jgi:hypothetical protein
MGGPGVDDFPARAADRGVDVLRMNASLHGTPPWSEPQGTNGQPGAQETGHIISVAFQFD